MQSAHTSSKITAAIDLELINQTNRNKKAFCGGPGSVSRGSQQRGPARGGSGGQLASQQGSYVLTDKHGTVRNLNSA